MSKKILIAEDEAALQKVLSEALLQEGYQVLQALDGERALQVILKEKPDLVLLDLILPKKDGFNVLKEMKESKAVKDTPVIILTNLEATRDVEKAISLGAKSYLVKSNYELQDVINKIKENLK